ncbi:phosphonate ABC transporter, permease protein PhnE [Oceanivirga miroungae]|uniref:Binding-protein-dependent transport system inner membrane protein n=1 Tax=Oceanivirga miroungae TaxID=1130046 RepID=A0A6I8MEI6_9FUSO|nr:phosphonate ABC transporter, permease protein PhnE [Oceanivirga miroungae]VWL85920.1 binding-protein-dependent transport system inner membrane protein [Oceanivirga miroungae]
MNKDEKIIKKLENEPSYKIKMLINFVIVVALIFWSTTGLRTTGFNSRGITIVSGIFKGFINPNMDLINLTKEGIPYLLLETMAIAFVGTVVGSILALPFGFLTSLNIVPSFIAYIIRVFLVMVRTIPTIVYGLIFIRIVGPGPFAGALTMAVTSVGMMSKLFSESIMDIDKDILEALDAMGLNTFEKIWHGILPQLSAIFLSTVIYRFDINLRDATILGLVGAGGIGAPLIFSINGFKWNEAGSILLCLIVLILLIEYFSTKLRNRLVKGY